MSAGEWRQCSAPVIQDLPLLNTATTKSGHVNPPEIRHSNTAPLYRPVGNSHQTSGFSLLGHSLLVLCTRLLIKDNASLSQLCIFLSTVAVASQPTQRLCHANNKAPMVEMEHTRTASAIPLTLHGISWSFNFLRIVPFCCVERTRNNTPPCLLRGSPFCFCFRVRRSYNKVLVFMLFLDTALLRIRHLVHFTVLHARYVFVSEEPTIRP